MAVLVVDSSTIISCAVNCILWIFDELKEQGIKFIVPAAVKNEVIDSGLISQKFKFEAIRVMHHFINKTFETYEGDLSKETSQLLSYSNSSFSINNKQLKVLQEADVQVAVLAKKIKADGVLTDERTLRMFIEEPSGIQKYLEDKFHTKVEVNNSAIKKFSDYIDGMPVMRSAELVVYAFQNGIFDPTIRRCSVVKTIDCRKEIISGLLYAIKFAGCAISFDEINDYVNIVLRGK
jgi:hypothetical protein